MQGQTCRGNGNSWVRLRCDTCMVGLEDQQKTNSSAPSSDHKEICIKLLTHEEAQLSAQYYHHTQGSDLMANPYCSTAFKPWQLLCDISPCSCSISGIQWNRQWGFSLEPERLFRVAGQESVIPPELENRKILSPILSATRGMCASKTSQFKRWK